LYVIQQLNKGYRAAKQYLRSGNNYKQMSTKIIWAALGLLAFLPVVEAQDDHFAGFEKAIDKKT
jgi:hypothetical protein